MAECGAKPLHGLGSCHLDRGHGGDYHEDGTTLQQWPTRRGDQKPRRQERERLKTESKKQAYRNGRLDGIRDQRLDDQRHAYLRGDIHWDPTAEVLTPPPGTNWCERCGEATAPDRLRLHHKVRRSQGVRATPEAQGDERIEDLELICQGPGSCHDDDHPGPFQEPVAQS